MKPEDYMRAARVPDSIPSCKFGLWEIYRQHPDKKGEWKTMTTLARVTLKTLHRYHGETIMEDSRQELRRHLPIWMSGRGRILVTGLGLGCVVRGLLSNSDVESIDVVEIDKGVIRVVGREFAPDPRVRIIHADATNIQWAFGQEWDCAWHDIQLSEIGALAISQTHLRMMFDLEGRVRRQGAWAMPREIKKQFPGMIG